MYKSLIFISTSLILSVVFIPVALFSFFWGCEKSDMPSDTEMIGTFQAKEDAFENIKNIIQAGIPGEHYPVFEYEGDTLHLKDIPTKERYLLDSLLVELGITRIFYTGIDADTLVKRDTSYMKRIELHYYSSGLGISGTKKNFLYAPDLVEYVQKFDRTIKSSPSIGGRSLKKIVYDDIDNYRSTNIPNIELYRPLKDDWYIYFERDS